MRKLNNDEGNLFEPLLESDSSRPSRFLIVYNTLPTHTKTKYCTHAWITWLVGYMFLLLINVYLHQCERQHWQKKNNCILFWTIFRYQNGLLVFSVSPLIKPHLLKHLQPICSPVRHLLCPRFQIWNRIPPPAHLLSSVSQQHWCLFPCSHLLFSLLHLLYPFCSPLTPLCPLLQLP